MNNPKFSEMLIPLLELAFALAHPHRVQRGGVPSSVLQMQARLVRSVMGKFS